MRSVHTLLFFGFAAFSLLSCQKNSQQIAQQKTMVLTQNPKIEVGSFANDQVILALEEFPKEVVYEGETFQIQSLSSMGSIKSADLFLMIEATAVAGDKSLRAAVPLSSPGSKTNSACEPYMHMCVVSLPLNEWEFPQDDNGCFFGCGSSDPNAGPARKSHSVSTGLFFEEAFNRLAYR